MKQIPLIEKYRVEKFSDIKGQDIAVVKLEAFFRCFQLKRL